MRPYLKPIPYCMAWVFLLAGNGHDAGAASNLDLGNEAFAKGKHAEALLHYRNALSSGENRPMARFNRGNCLYVMKQAGHALQAYE